MNAVDRRQFLKGVGGLVLASSAGSVVLDVLLPNGTRTAGADILTDTLPLGTPICINIVMDGGNDYLNTLIPVDNPWYFDATYGHGALALDPAKALALTGLDSYRLHAGLPFLAERWNTTGDVAFVLGVGEQNRKNFSHFDSMAYWQTADLSLLEPTGWLGRFADRKRPGSPLATVSLGDLRREAVGTSAPALVVRDAAEFKYWIPPLNESVFRAGLDRMATIQASGPLGEAASVIESTFAVTARVSGAADSNVTGGGPYHALTSNLLQAAVLVRAGIPSQSYTVSFGPFDSHNDQHNMQATRFGELDAALRKFFGALAGHPRANDVFVMITSEFGRQATANRTAGTDHGQAGMAMFVGGGVKRGVYGQAPTLDPGGPTRPNRVYDALKPTVDFRALHYTALTRLSDAATAEAVLKGVYPQLGVFGATAPPPPTTTTTVKPTTTTVKPTTTTTVKPTTTTTVANLLPVASFTATVGSLRKVTVDGTASKDPDGSIKTWSWSWGDGTTGTGSRTSKSYRRGGTYTVTLTVTDAKGAKASTSKSLTVR